jgi:hypothetical protein
MRPLSRHCRRPTSEMFAGMLIAILLAGTSLAYADGASTSPATPLNDFRSQLGDVKKSLEGVNAKIEDRAKAIETLSKPDAARQQVEELQALVSHP